MPINSDPSQQPREGGFFRTFLPWGIALALLFVTAHSYGKASYHAMVWATLGALVLSVLCAWWGVPMSRRSGPFGKRLKVTCLIWGLPFAMGIGAAFDLPAHYAPGPVVTTTVHYTTGSSRHCIVAVRFYLQAIGGTVHTCVGRGEVGALPGSASGVVTVKETPYGVELLKFQSQ